ncbi:MAG: nuclear transport factor 2 family protein [Acidobacteria bacterium]|nr:nuclear transport factor 2 family protein [Acidobacteriota bacterium]
MADYNPGAEQEVRAAVAEFNRAAREGDGPALDAMLGDELFYGHSNALMESKVVCIDHLLRGRIDFRDEPGSEVQIHGNTGIFHGRTMAHNPKPDGVVVVPLDMVQVWVRRDGRWQMVARHTTRLPAA